jgi:hypothetical protein
MIYPFYKRYKTSEYLTINMNSNIDDLIYFIKFWVECEITNYNSNILQLTQEETKDFNSFYFEDNVKLVMNKWIIILYQNEFGYDNNNFDYKLNKLCETYLIIETKQNNKSNCRDYKKMRCCDYFNINILVDIIANLFNEKQTVLK